MRRSDRDAGSGRIRPFRGIALYVRGICRRKRESRRLMANRAHIAILGMACRAPGVSSPEQFWHALRDPSWPGAARFLDAWDEFDAASFAITPAEASWIDPQQRVFLECAREALERAG